MELCSCCGHPYKDRLNGGIQEPCCNPHCLGCPQFVSEKDMAWDAFGEYLREKEEERLHQADADWALHILAQDRAYREAVEASWPEDETDDAKCPDGEGEEEPPYYTQVWYTESPGGHNYYE